jgi:hypothetical protein
MKGKELNYDAHVGWTLVGVLVAIIPIIVIVKLWKK